ncbi:MAG: hypothetical protein KDB00_26785 [Planctomycetales bacterium]|nr:hypothetical protein [Planctomycetales bacterium]
MKSIPIVPHCRPDPPGEWIRAIPAAADAFLRERPELALPLQFTDLRLEQLGEGPTLVLDDLSEIPGLDRKMDARFYQDRARLRAGDGDVVVSCSDLVPGLEDYFRNCLGLGAPEWLRPPPPRTPLRVAEACWDHDQTRTRLIERLRGDELRYIHPHMGTMSVWELAFLLRSKCERPIGVIAPPPGVCQWVNNKVSFAATVKRLFGPELVPCTESACNLAYIAKRVSELSQQSEVIGLKLPSSAGGLGNLVINAQQLRGCSLTRLREMLKNRLQELYWESGSEVLIDRWETEVVSSPSAQLWIPPINDGEPVVEGVFTQAIEGSQYSFAGSEPSRLPETLNQEIVDRCWVLGMLFQRLGYVGRCSFDMILVGRDLHTCRIEMIECNGRWGGTSLPMTLMNRIFRDWIRQPYAVRIAHDIINLNRFTFSSLLEWFGMNVFDQHTGTGNVIFIDPGRMKSRSGIEVLVLGESWEQAICAADCIAERIRQFASAASNNE